MRQEAVEETLAATHLDGSKVDFGGGITLDGSGGVTLSGTWSRGYSGSVQRVTASDGRCAETTGNIRKRNRSTTFTVSDIEHLTFTYADAGNHDPDGDSDGTSITVPRP